MTTEILDRPSETETKTNPFPGLRPFNVDESDLFFGREGQSEKLLSILRRTRFLAVVGTSGSGKSSLVNAGLLPALYGGLMRRAGSNWRVAKMRPGDSPISRLSEALNGADVFGAEGEEDKENAEFQKIITNATLRRGSKGLIEAVRQMGLPPSDNLLIVVDQFEELFRVARSLGSDNYKDEAAAFVKLLLEAKSQEEIPIYIVITMRSDFLGDCAQFWNLPEAINEGQYLIPRLTRDERREAITGPIAVSEGAITPQLVNQLINETEDDPGLLPILQHALMRTWDIAQADLQAGKPLDLHHFEAAGTMVGALSRHADEAYNELSDEQKLIAEKLFKQLTEKEADGREIRRPTKLSEICAVARASEAAVIEVIDVFRREGRSFLTPSADVALNGDSIIDISHESLIRGWKRLGDWVDDEAKAARGYRRLADQAMLHKSGNAGLLDELDVKLALEWCEHAKPDKVWAERYGKDEGYDLDVAMEFLETCREEVEKEIRQRRHELRRARIYVVVLSILLVFCVGLLWNAVKTQYDFNLYRYTQGIGSSLKAFAGGNVPEGNSALGSISVDKSKNLRGFEWYYSWWVGHSEWATIQQGPKAVARVAYSPKGDQLAAGDVDGNVIVWNEGINAGGSSWQRPKPLYIRGYTAPVTALVYAPDSALLVAGYADGVIRRWDASGKEVGSLLPIGSLIRLPDNKVSAIYAIAFTPDGSTLRVGLANGTEVSWDLKSNQKTGEVNPPEHKSTVQVMAFSSDGKSRAIGYEDGVVLWQETGKEPVRLSRPDSASSNLNRIFSITFSPPNFYRPSLAIGYADGIIATWDLNPAPATKPRLLGQVKKSDNADGSAAAELEKKADNHHLGPVLTIVFIGADMLATGSADGTVKVWRLTNNDDEVFLTTRKGHKSGVSSLAIAPDQKTLVTGSDDGSVKTWDVAWADKATPITQTNISTAAFSGTGDRLATGRVDGQVTLWDTSTWQPTATLPSMSTDTINALSFSPDGARLAVGSADGVVYLCNLGNSAAPTKLWQQAAAIESLAFSPDGATLAIGDANGRVHLWSIGNQKESASVKLSDGPIYALAYSPDGSTLAIGDGGARVTLRDASAPQKPGKPIEGLNAITSLAFSVDGKRLIAGNKEGIVGLYIKKESWLETWTEPLLRSVGRESQWEQPLPLKGASRAREVHAIAVSPNALAIITVQRKGDQRIGEGSLELLRAAKEDTIARQQVIPEAADQ
jgi:WD40 repeat protein/energy-coupling factor transporter ATP-binding protein EcfA2